ncbi:uncharacterized protein N7500_008442, partial [Penicillium coprophilum]|uniref:uncharacterized protein n=1 Tax=Penicillium coprophilum TaxID=36646 RepID=UPI0023915950
KRDRHRYKLAIGRRAILTGAIIKAPIYKSKYPLDNLTSYKRELSIITTISRIPALIDYTPRIVKADPSSGIIILSTLKLY